MMLYKVLIFITGELLKTHLISNVFPCCSFSLFYFILFMSFFLFLCVFYCVVLLLVVSQYIS
jgi:hypothetical protein